MLCAALMLAFASASMASVVDHIQHQPGMTSSHNHHPFSKIVFDTSDHHHEHAAADLGEEEESPDRQPGTGHHHHVDSGSGMFVPVSHETSWTFSGALLWQPAVDDRMPGFLTHGPERPPKGSTIHT